MDYIYVVYYSESNYEAQSNVEAFQYEESAKHYIARETELNPKIGQYLDYEKIKISLS